METHLKKKNVNTSNGKHYHIKVYDDEDMAMDKAKELNEEEQSQDYESDVYYTVLPHDLIKKSDIGK